MADKGVLKIVRDFETEIERVLKTEESFKIDLFDFREDEIDFLKSYYTKKYDVEVGLDLKLFQRAARPYAIFRHKKA